MIQVTCNIKSKKNKKQKTKKTKTKTKRNKAKRINLLAGIFGKNRLNPLPINRNKKFINLDFYQTK